MYTNQEIRENTQIKIAMMYARLKAFETGREYSVYDCRGCLDNGSPFEVLHNPTNNYQKIATFYPHPTGPVNWWNV